MKARFNRQHSRRMGWLQRVAEGLQQAWQQLQQTLAGAPRTAVLRPIPIRIEPTHHARRQQRSSRHDWRD